MDLSKSGENTDMGSPETLSNFIDWSLKNYPAKHYWWSGSWSGIACRHLVVCRLALCCRCRHAFA